MRYKEKKLLNKIEETSIEDIDRMYQRLENAYSQLLKKQNIDIEKCFCGGNENFLLELKKSF